jgi:two-component system response regulator AtoC
MTITSSQYRPQILIADDEANLRRVVAAQLERDGFEVHAVADGEEAVEFLREHHVDLVISDLRMPKLDGMALLDHVVAHHAEIPVILITAHGTVDTAVKALKKGAFDYVTKPFDRDELRQVVWKAVRFGELSRRDARPQADAHGRYGIIGQSAAMQDIYQVIEKVADSPSTVLLTGESGTGKELIARALHEHSSRRERAYIRVNCAAIPAELIESELFGYEKGAFTGAVTSKPGRFELAHGGTLFLDEISEIPVNMQVKLLRAIQESEFERVGGIKTLRVDVRLIAATNRDLPAEIAAGRFREDLYYRLNVVKLHVPPLRERKEDIPRLIEHFLQRFNARLRKSIRGLSPAVQEIIARYPWPGNIRELENVMERCALFCDGDLVEVADLPPEIKLVANGNLAPGPLPHAHRDPHALPDAADKVAIGDLKQAVRQAAERVERELIQRTLAQTGGNVTHTARLLKISRKGLQTKMKELGLRSGGEDPA